jgi:hypothetical protein
MHKFLLFSQRPGFINTSAFGLELTGSLLIEHFEEVFGERDAGGQPRRRRTKI